MRLVSKGILVRVVSQVMQYDATRCDDDGDGR